MNPIRKAMAALPGHWTKNTYADGAGNFCGLGHVARAAGEMDENGGFPRSMEQFTILEPLMTKIAHEQYPERFECIGSFAVFNDHPDTTEEEVLRVMDKAAVELDAQV